ncbi:MAG: glycosyltransferase family 2 protein [Sulfurimicrobium sp.]|jgi:glycosyltransferase involved in cell wall biosynthesis|nr:glycosyltransferase family 2 protein [Sulfurimicrobium sp.]
MATYNGSAYIEEQLASLRAQSYADWRLWIRDDGSTDGTVETIRRFAAQDERVRLLEPDGIRKGASGSFFSLLERFASEADYLMFCDQDDVWLPNKVEITLARMQEMEARFGMETPLLVHTDLSVADCDLNVLASSFWCYQGLNPDVKGLSRLLVQNNVTGCTTMVNRALAGLACPAPSGAIMHDWWLAVVAAGFGKIGCVPQPTMLYRQHGANDIGAKKYGIAYMSRKMLAGLGAMKASLLETQSQACLFLECYASRLAPEQRSLVKAYCHFHERGFWTRRWQMLRFGYFKHGLFRNIGMFLSL